MKIVFLREERILLAEVVFDPGRLGELPFLQDTIVPCAFQPWIQHTGRTLSYCLCVFLLPPSRGCDAEAAPHTSCSLRRDIRSREICQTPRSLRPPRARGRCGRSAWASATSVARPTCAMGSEAAQLVEAADFAARKHRLQRRKDPEGTPSINHPIGGRTAPGAAAAAYRGWGPGRERGGPRSH